MDIKWMLRRMRAMSASELAWRVQMKALTKREKKLFYDKHLPVTQFAPDKPRKPDGARLSLNWENEGTRYTGMRMFDCYEERDYRTRWNAGFAKAARRRRSASWRARCTSARAASTRRRS